MPRTRYYDLLPDSKWPKKTTEKNMIERLKANMQTVFCLSDIEKECFGKDAWTVRNLIAEFDNNYSYLFGAFEGEDLVGYACVRIMYEEAQVCNVAVLPNYRRKGYGTALIAALTECATENECRYCELEVNVKNQEAIALYTKCGYTIAGTRKNFYRKTRYDSRDAYTMTLNLPEPEKPENEVSNS